MSSSTELGDYQIGAGLESSMSDTRHASTTESWFRDKASLPDLASLVSRLGVEGPRSLRSINVEDTSVPIGQGSQFIVFAPDPEWSNLAVAQNRVIKRVKLPRMNWNQDENVENSEYAKRLRHVALEILSLCHPKLRGHRNIVRLLGWGYDFEDRQTRLPILFMERASMSLSKALSDPVTAFDGCSASVDDIKYQIALDISAGLEVLHSQNLVHGDMKPDNVLLFPGPDPDVPFVAKLSDFGLCIDLERGDVLACKGRQYTSTPGWRGPEVDEGYDEKAWGTFDDASLLFKFDAYGFALVVLSIFATDGKPPFSSDDSYEWQQSGETASDAAIEMLDFLPIDPDVRGMLKRMLGQMLTKNPRKRALPSPRLLKSGSPVFTRWSDLHAQAVLEDMPLGFRDHLANRGPAFWRGLDRDFLNQLDQQFRRGKESHERTKHSGETLFGMAQQYAKFLEPSDVDNMLYYLYQASEEGHTSAQAICPLIYRALERPLPVDVGGLREWQEKAVQEGFLFSKSDELWSPQDIATEKQKFRALGGYCRDAFMGSPEIRHLSTDLDAIHRWIRDKGYHATVDRDGNSLLHLCAALGSVESLNYLLCNAEYTPLMRNNLGESPLHKACQAGNLSHTRMLIAHGEKGHPSAVPTVTPLHWLLAFSEEDTPEATRLLVFEGENDVNSTIIPSSTPARFPRPIEALHFPFVWPYGTPLHWAAFMRNLVAMEALVSVGAKVDAMEAEGGVFTTPLARSIYLREAEVAAWLIDHGASTSSIDSKGRNLLHIMSSNRGSFEVLDYKFNGWIRQGTWEERVVATQSIIRRLQDSGVGIDRQHTGFDNLSPLTQATGGMEFHECAAFALLSEGANADVVTGTTNKTVLHCCAGKDKRRSAYPRGYDTLLNLTVEKTSDLNAWGEDNCRSQTALHTIAHEPMDIKQFEENTRLLLMRQHTPGNVNVADSLGETPLMATLAVAPQEQVLDRMDILLQLGADPRIIGNDGFSALTAIAQNKPYMDAQSQDLMQYVVAKCNFDSEALAQFIDNNTISTLMKPCNEGKLRTVEYLLHTGFQRRINEEDSGPWAVVIGDRPLDRAFKGAGFSRRGYLMRASQYPRLKDLHKAMENGHFWGGFGKTMGGQSHARAHEAYHTFPDLLRLLLDQGAERNPKCIDEEGPSYCDAVEAPMWGFTHESQPNKAHWSILYELEQPEKEWEKIAGKTVQDIYEDNEVLRFPSVLLFERWPEELTAVLKPNNERWYKACLNDNRKVRIKLEKGKIAAIKDWKGDPLSVCTR